MANVQILPKAGEGFRREWRATGALTDNDVGKPVKLANDRVELCADGDAIYGFIDSVERGTDGGYVVVTVIERGTVRVTASGTLAQGAVVEAAANAAAGVAKTVNWGAVSTHTAAAGEKNWMVLQSAADGEDTVVQLV